MISQKIICRGAFHGKCCRGTVKKRGSRMKIKSPGGRNKNIDYTHTVRACYIGYVIQAIVNNLAPLLYLTFMTQYQLDLGKITLITTLNFSVQLIVDLLSAKFIDRIGYRASVLFAHFMAFCGLIGLALLPDICKNPYTGILISVICYAVGGGIIEVLISPIVESCPTSKKEASMSLLHSFYCWGHLLVVLLSTLYFRFVGISKWKYLALLWSIVPVLNFCYFLLVPIDQIRSKKEQSAGKRLFFNRAFWIFILLMFAAGASEQAMGQWVSAFAESALHVSKTVGDLVGPCLFALFMGLSRLFYGKFCARLPLKNAIVASSALCLLCYLGVAFFSSPYLALIACAATGFSVGIFWPGTISLASAGIKNGGTALFALLALSGDLGCSGGPTFVGLIANASGGNLKTGLLAALIFPVLMMTGICCLPFAKE